MNSIFKLSVFLVILMLYFAFGCEKQEEKTVAEKTAEANLQLDKIPQVVMDGFMAKFPGAEIHDWTKEKEDDIVIYDFEFTQDGWNFEADIKEDGSIYNWEKAIRMNDLPDFIKMTIDTKYPGSTVKEIMEITTVVDGQDVLEGYEIVFEAADMEEVEIMVTPEGEIIKESDEMQSEEE
jgi:hypothetical protein